MLSASSGRTIDDLLTGAIEDLQTSTVREFFAEVDAANDNAAGGAIALDLPPELRRRVVELCKLSGDSARFYAARDGVVDALFKAARVRAISWKQCDAAHDCIGDASPF